MQCPMHKSYRVHPTSGARFELVDLSNLVCKAELKGAQVRFRGPLDGSKWEWTQGAKMPLRHRSCTSEFAPLLASPQCHTTTVRGASVRPLLHARLCVSRHTLLPLMTRMNPHYPLSLNLARHSEHTIRTFPSNTLPTPISPVEPLVRMQLHHPIARHTATRLQSSIAHDNCQARP